MKKKGKKVLAILMAALMVVGIMPMDWAATVVSAKTVTANIDISAGLKAGTVYGDESVVKISVLEDMNFKEAAAKVDGVDYTGYVQGKTNPKPKEGAIPTEGAAFKVDAVVDGSVTFITKSATKVYHFVDAETLTDTTGTEVPAGSMKFDVTAGHTYYFYLDGSKICAYGISYSYEKASDYQKVDIDVTGGLKAAETYGKDTLANVTVLEDMNFKEAAANVDGLDYTGYVQGKTNPKPKGGAIPTEGAAFKVDAVVDGSVTFITKSATKVYHFVDAETLKDVTGTEVPAGSMKFDITAGHTYYFYLDGSKICAYGITLEAGTPDLNWNDVAAPVLGTPVVEGGEISVPYTAVIGDDGGEVLTVDMYMGTEKVDTQLSKVPGASGTVKFTPSVSGEYTFKATLSREGQTDKVSNETAAVIFSLPLTKPEIDTITSKGNGNVEVVFASVAEATEYEVFYSEDGTTFVSGAKTTDTVAVIKVPKTGIEYNFKVVASRGSETSESDVKKAKVVAEAQQTWTFSAFGQGVSSDSDNCGYSGNANDGSVTVWDLNNKGKLVPASTDGLSFYYTAIPTNMNFTLSAKVTIDKWTYTNGQEGFGLMAADRVGTNGDSSVFWNNSYMDTVTKVEYFADSEGNITDDTTAKKISMKLGIGSQEKTGVNKDNLSKLEANDTEAVNKQFSSKMTALDTSCALKDAGTYNVVGNYTNTDATFGGTVVDKKTTFVMTIQRNNTGYFVSYTDEAGNTVTKKYYDTKALDQLDTENVYAGFFASRTCKATFSDIKLTTIAPENDAPAEEQPVTLITPSYAVTSGTVANSEAYKLTYVSNADGHVVITDADGNVIADQDVTANTKCTFDTKVKLGKNEYTVTATPNENYKPSEFEAMSSYEPVTFTHTVTYDNFSGDVIYVSPEGTSKGIGTKENPVDVYTAVKFAKAGQTIVVLGGTYNLESTVKIERGIDGTAEAPIKMIREPGTSEDERPVFDFGGNCEGMVIAGNYWYIQGFDVTNSANGKDGIRLSGSNVTMDNMHTYKNGNTGLQISRYISTDTWEDWPANNLVLNCTSWSNADAGYEDADGFAAKLTIGEGNVFDGCVAYNNADDGWDLFAKVETGAIGSVTIQNCVAFANGYGEDGTNEGNGNGFKMGGSSMSGYHKLINSVAFDNKAKGIDSNSCPDIQVTNCTSFNNGSNNVAFYTNDAANTDFMATGVLSYRTQFTDVAENFKFRGTQDATKVYNSTNYFWNYQGMTRAVDDAHNSAVEVLPTWFKRVDTHMDYTTHTYSQLPVTRNADGTVNMNDVLVLTSEAKAGAVVQGVASKVFSLEGLSTTSGLMAPKTGDMTTAVPFVFMIIMSAAMVAGVYFFDKKRKTVVRR